MLRKIILITFLMVASLVGSTQSHASVPRDHRIQNDDRWTHWPWRLAQPFPWGDIQGVWKVQEGGYASYFTFRRLYVTGSEVRQLKVKQIDASTCAEVGSGVGIESGSFIYAQMSNKDGSIYRLNLSAFKCSDSPMTESEKQSCNKGSMMVLSMGELSAQNLDEMVHMRIVKLTPEMIEKNCFSNKK